MHVKSREYPWPVTGESDITCWLPYLPSLLATCPANHNPHQCPKIWYKQVVRPTATAVLSLYYFTFVLSHPLPTHQKENTQGKHHWVQKYIFRNTGFGSKHTAAAAVALMVLHERRNLFGGTLQQDQALLDTISASTKTHTHGACVHRFT